jgi:acetyl-CoA carboxylase carboxyl transferase subunit beta
MIFVPQDLFEPDDSFLFSFEEEDENENEDEKEEEEEKDYEEIDENADIDAPELTVLAYLKEQRKIRDLLNPLAGNANVDRRSELWIRCDDCGSVLYLTHLRDNNDLCMGCGHHLRMSSLDRIELFVDRGSWRSLFDQFSSCDPLEFEDYDVYAERTIRSQESTNLQDAIQTGTAFVDSVPVALAVMDFGYMGGSMGSVVGEKLTRLIEYATAKGLCLIVICASGGARMQEGSLSLMQMAKISSALYNYQKRANLAYINILTSPTTGGVTASFGMLADFIVTEPKSIIGFAGRRVIEATIGEILPPNFQTAEYLLERGHVDIKVKRKYMREVLSNLIWATNRGNYKRAGFIERGLHNGLTHFKEERARRVLNRIDYKPLKDLSFYTPKLTDKNLYASFNNRLAELKAKGAKFNINLENETESYNKDQDKNKEKTKKGFLYSGKSLYYKSSELVQFLLNPTEFLKNLSVQNNGEESLIPGPKKLKKFSKENKETKKIKKTKEEKLKTFLKFYNDLQRKKLHGIPRLESNGKGFEKPKNSSFEIPTFEKSKWVYFGNIKKNNGTGNRNNGTGNNGAGTLSLGSIGIPIPSFKDKSKNKKTYITGMSGTGTLSTGSYSTWTQMSHIRNNGTANNGTGNNGTGANAERENGTRNNGSEKQKAPGPMIKINSIVPFSKSKGSPKPKGKSSIPGLKRLFLTRASNASYLQVLGSYQAVEHLFNSSIVEREERKCKPVSFAFNYHRDSLVQKFGAFDEAIAFAKAQSLHWRNVYDGASAPQKLAPFESGILKRTEKRFFYYILEKHINLLEKRRANRLANPEMAANERLTKKNADANVTRRAANLQFNIDKDFKFVLGKKFKKSPKKK